ncbi:hypothetical protein [Bradyrhizobium tropiciagri]|uniref:hypothetical protein n=1 Tax=Bradyrhizobium tropiciagri TaxID=312253 RepID=UPI000B187B00|nr:hypothetical protein [Bradyrhizobium tropiciagri]
MGNVVSSSISAERTIAYRIVAVPPARKPVAIVLRSTDTSCGGPDQPARASFNGSTGDAAVCERERDPQTAPSEPRRATTARDD